jgi:hypothetical protein
VNACVNACVIDHLSVCRTSLYNLIYVSMRQRMLTYADVCCLSDFPLQSHLRQHASAYVRIRQHASAYVSLRQHTSACVSIRQHTSAYVSIRQHTSAYVSMPVCLSDFP